MAAEPSRKRPARKRPAPRHPHGELRGTAVAPGPGMQMVAPERRLLLESMPWAVLGFDANRRIDYANGKAAELFGQSVDEVIGKRLRGAGLAGPGVRQWEERQEEVFRTGQPQIFAHTVRREQRDYELETRLLPEVDENGSTRRILCISRNINETEAFELAAKESDKRFRRIIEQAPVGICVTDHNGYFIQVNAAYLRFYGYREDELIGRHFTLVVPEAHRAFMANLHDEFIANEHEILAEWDVITRNNEPKVILADAVRVVGSGGHYNKITFVIDVTEKKQAERALQERERDLAKAQEIAHVGSWRWNADEDILHWTAETYRIYEIKPSVTGNNLWKAMRRRVHPDDRERFAAYEKAIREGRQSEALEYRLRLPKGREKVLWSEFEPIRHNGRVTGAAGAVHDITARKRAETELRASREELKRLSEHLQHVREQESTRLAARIHDNLGQELTALKMEIVLALKQLPQDHPVITRNRERILDTLEQTLSTVKQLALELRPHILNDLGLEAAMEWQLGEFERRGGIPCELTTRGFRNGLSDAAATGLFRIFQEALTNIARHARATRVHVTLTTTKSGTRLSVRDNGVGMPEARADSPDAFGIVQMRERAQALGGTLHITGKTGQGTTVSVTIPDA